ncbi:unnamed protein product [Mytilus coruscus]|uniref:Uncharacterized protein n=1 Tax=Mytilus coruscus TaxID=42192 RepID=A0A6J8A932_MYTCO|nr:unnamed protein product [Mytilus coruscus]
MQTETIIYIICTSCVTFVLTLCLVALNRYRRKRNRHLNVQHVITRDNNENNTVNCNQEQNHYEKVYDTIDESKMIDMPGQHSIQAAESSSDSSIKDDFNLSDGYLNPYQPMVPDPDIHDYLHAKPLDENDPLKHSNQDQDHSTFHRLSSTNEQELQELSTSVKISQSLFPEIETGIKCSDYVSMN